MAYSSLAAKYGGEDVEVKGLTRSANGDLNVSLADGRIALTDEAVQRQDALESAGAATWYKPDGSFNYPPNNGAVVGTEETITLQSGGKLGRFGEVRNSSNYVTDVDIDPNKLALPPNTNPAQYYEYEILKPIPHTVKSTVAEWPIGSGTGGAPQYELPMPIEDLRLQGFIKLIIK